MASETTTPTRRRRGLLIALLAAALALLIVVVVVALLWRSRPRLSEDQVRGAVYSAIQREAPASFLITGYLDVTVTTTLENTRRLLPGLLDLNVGTTRSTVRMPGRVSYGFDVRQLEPSMIRLRGDSLVQVALPPIAIYSVEPRLSRMEVRTDKGWLRFYDESEHGVERRAIGFVDNAMRRQAYAYLQDSSQPRINTAVAIEKMLTPVLASVGLEDARVQVQVSPRVLVAPERRPN